ncbi:hypothetical protein NHQ30_011374 [Ciborinia camelliae]|nr:hypothetical protein NHQ30_011374 [Ciborinia camelliae]
MEQSRLQNYMRIHLYTKCESPLDILFSYSNAVFSICEFGRISSQDDIPTNETLYILDGNGNMIGTVAEGLCRGDLLANYYSCSNIHLTNLEPICLFPTDSGDILFVWEASAGFYALPKLAVDLGCDINNMTDLTTPPPPATFSHYTESRCSIRSDTSIFDLLRSPYPNLDLPVSNSYLVPDSPPSTSPYSTFMLHQPALDPDTKDWQNELPAQQRLPTLKSCPERQISMVESDQQSVNALPSPTSREYEIALVTDSASTAYRNSKPLGTRGADYVKSELTYISMLSRKFSHQRNGRRSWDWNALWRDLNIEAPRHYVGGDLNISDPWPPRKYTANCILNLMRTKKATRSRVKAKEITKFISTFQDGRIINADSPLLEPKARTARNRRKRDQKHTCHSDAQSTRVEADGTSENISTDPDDQPFSPGKKQWTDSELRYLGEMYSRYTAQYKCYLKHYEWLPIIAAMDVEAARHRPGGILSSSDPWPQRKYHDSTLRWALRLGLQRHIAYENKFQGSVRESFPIQTAIFEALKDGPQTMTFVAERITRSIPAYADTDWILIANMLGRFLHKSSVRMSVLYNYNPRYI